MNGISLENVDHATAISVLKDSGSTVNLVSSIIADSRDVTAVLCINSVEPCRARLEMHK